MQGYTSFYKFCEDRLGVKRDTVRRMLAVNLKFCHSQGVLPECYKRFSCSQLAIMSGFENGLEGKITPETTCQQLDKLSKYYASQDWHVNLDTTWQDDLKDYEQKLREKRAAKNRYLKSKKYQSVTDVIISETPKKRTETSVPLTKKYDAYTLALERMKDQIPLLKKNGAYTYGLDELSALLDRLLSSAEAAKTDEILSFQSDV